MPRIRAATVAEHRAAQRAALLDAARELLAEAGAEAPSLAAVAQRAGLARSSIYSYFKSRDDLLDALIADTFPRWSAYVTDQMRNKTPGERILAYIDANLRLVARGDHAVVRVLTAAGHAEALAEQGTPAHDRLRAPLVTALAEHGVTRPAATADIIQAMLYTVSRMIEDGITETEGRRLTRELLGPFLVDNRSVVAATSTHRSSRKRDPVI